LGSPHASVAVMCKHELSASTARRTERRCTSRRGATSCSSVDTRPRKCQLATPSARCQPTGPGTRPEQQAETASDVAIVVRAIQGLDEAAVNREVRAGDTTGAVAGQHEDEVGDLGRAVNRPVTAPAAAWAAPSAGPYRPLGRRSGRRRDRPATVGSTGPGLMVLTRMPAGPSSFDKGWEPNPSADVHCSACG
jgi:hypothetical protein